MAVKKFNTRIQLKNDSLAEWTSHGNLVLLGGEFAWNSTNKNFKIGDGQSAFSELNYVLPAFGNTLTSTTTDGITTYNVNIDGTSIVSNNGVLSAVAAATPYKLTVGSMEYNGGANREIKVGTGLKFSPASGASDNITILHSNSGVTADTYGSTTAIPVITVDAQGHVTNASQTSITVGSGALTLTGDSWLTVGTGTGFNANSTENSTYTIAHAAVTPTDTTATSTITPGGTAVLLSVASDAAGHITGKTETTATFATVDVASASATGFFADAKQVKDYVDNMTADLSGAMHFRSVITTTGSSNYVDQINTYYGGTGIPAAEVGDVFVDSTRGKEYVVKSLPGSGSLTAANIEEFGSVNPETTVASFKASTSTTGLTVTPTNGTPGAVTMTVDATPGYGIPTTTQLTKINNITVTANSVTDGTTTLNFASVAWTGAAAQLAVTSGNYGGDTAVTNAQDALTNLSTAMGSHTHNISDLTEDPAISTGDNTVIFDCGTATTCTNTVFNS